MLCSLAAARPARLLPARRFFHHTTAAMDGHGHHPPGMPPPSSPPAPAPPPSLAFVSAEELRARLVGDSGGGAARPLVLDVRDGDERAPGHIAGSLHVPAHRLRGDGPAADAELDAVIECVERMRGGERARGKGGAHVGRQHKPRGPPS